MNNHEAIEWLHVIRTGFICDPQECGLEKGGDPCRAFHCREQHDALVYALECIEKQIPMKPTLYEDKYYGCDCGNVLAFKYEAPGLTYCLNCGQAIDWSDNE